jgi:peptidoglycan/LPS O-acetylase OafA/YrhL
MSTGHRNPRIDMIRGISILLVLLHHFNIAYRLNDTPLARLVSWNALRAVVRNGNYGVTMFFVISGYLIASNANRRWPDFARMDVRGFYVMRIARIVPCLLLVLGIADILALSDLVIFKNHAPQGALVSLWVVNLASLTFWMNVLIGLYGWVNYPLGVLWSLSVEEVFYLAFPLLCVLLRRPSRLIAFWAVIIVVGPLYRAAHQGNEGGFLYSYFACFDGIAIGCCTALLAGKRPLPLLAKGPVQILALAIMAFLYLSYPIGETNTLGVTVMAFGTAVLLIGAHRSHSDVSQRWAGAGLRWFGRHSYELYLFHLLVLGAMRSIFVPLSVGGAEKMLLLFAFLLLSVALSQIIARFYAEPLNVFLRRLLWRPAGTDGQFVPTKDFRMSSGSGSDLS